MSSDEQKTDVYLTIYKREIDFFSGWSIGAELKRGDITYFIYSLFLPLSDFKNKTDVLRYMITTVLNDIDDEEGVILFYSPLDHFFKIDNLHEMAEPYKKGRNVRFFRRWYLPITTKQLENDAFERGYSISERFESENIKGEVNQ